MAATPRPSLVHHQPLRVIYQAGKVSYTLAKLPIWLACATIPSLRPHRKWTFAQTILIKVFRVVLDTLYGSVEVTEDRPLDQNKPGELIVVPTTETAEPEFYTGPLSTSATVTPITILGNAWVPGPPSPKTAHRQKVVMQIHARLLPDQEMIPI